MVGLLWVVCFFNYADRQAIFSVFPLLKSELQLTDLQLGFVGSSFMWVYALSAPLAGLVADRFSRKSLILGGFLFWSAITVATAYATQYSHLILFRALEGLGEAFYFPASLSLMSDYHQAGTRSRALAIHQSSVYAGTIAGGTLAGYWGQVHGWRYGFSMFGYAGLFIGVALLFLIKEPRRTEAPQGGATKPIQGIALGLREIFSVPMALVLAIVFIGANFVASIFLTWMPTYLFRTFGMTLSVAGFSSTVFLQVASITGVIVGGVLADRMILTSRGGRMKVQTIGLLCAAPFLVLAGWTLSIPVLILSLTVFGFCKGLYDANLWASLYDVVRPDRRATACGVMNSLGWLGGGLAPVAIAKGAEFWGMGACLSATGLLYLLLGLVLAYCIRRYMSAPQMEPHSNVITANHA